MDSTWADNPKTLQDMKAGMSRSNVLRSLDNTLHQVKGATPEAKAAAAGLAPLLWAWHGSDACAACHDLCHCRCTCIKVTAAR